MSDLAARVRALADEWHGQVVDARAHSTDNPLTSKRHVVRMLRALLAEDETPASSDDTEALIAAFWGAASAKDQARKILASDWLAEHDERIRIEAYERGLADPGSAWMKGNGERERAAVVGALWAAADAVEDDCTHSTERCFCGSSEWLRERADRIEAQQ